MGTASGAGTGSTAIPKQRRLAARSKGQQSTPVVQESAQAETSGRAVRESGSNAAPAAGQRGWARRNVRGRKKTAASLSRRSKAGKNKPRSVAGSTGQGPAVARKETSGTALASSTRTASGAFVDARSLPSDDALLQQSSAQSKQGLGVFVKPKVVDFKARLKERQRANMRALIVRWSIIVAAIAAVIAVIWALCFSPALLLHRDEIRVSGGNEWVSDQEILDIVKKEEGRSLLLVSSSNIENSISGLPGVTSAKVDKQFPHGVKVTFKAQEPAAVLKSADGKITAVDRNGGVLNEVAQPPQGIPLIEVPSLDKGVGDHAVRQALKILAGLPDSMRQRVSKVTAQTQDSVTTELDGGQRVVVWGDASDLKLKMAVVDKIVNDPAKIGDKHQVDVSAPMRPIIK
ncbi:cell division protein FtsQ [Bombiscardovia apis]|uniref:Cell division protein FtsQ n=2 Tax=Bombiscardovia apis TaxID=2932182 RepID=A0ABN6SFE5_9BIFI|nr:cell division protein FtsQ [Bombiscardovia apis]